ncbi:hypothetical protein ST201phi2-1p232 [Pseudomonas phage 201phi2-1]|uniref:Uncharacterized protein n=1 Tax=Pseudomonas phage 201phi2-1 TaxID=198110 RepID=B3FJ94_BP201|nr:hypothetical protein ST201phi2-1p232 [Pseudomonas phage 201phi2-1]ABY63061.1 hypothetical protein 201phi2-1p232 [Pseudomonas phage 201phi2-1]
MLTTWFNMHEANQQMRTALTESIHELFLSEDSAHSAGFIEILNGIRSDLNLLMMDSKYVEKYVWEKFRKPTSMQQTLISTTATFLQGVDNIDEVIEQMVPRLIPFTSKSMIVDDETIGKAVEHHDLVEILKDNYWLFFVVYATTNMRVVLETTLEYAQKS